MTWRRAHGPIRLAPYGQSLFGQKACALMGTEINLNVGGISLSFSKNHMGIDFGHLFQEIDRTRRKMDGINYEYFKDNPEEIADFELSEMVFARRRDA